MEKWFDPTVYMQNKLAQMQATDPAYTMSDLVAAFADAGFVGEEGYFQHFLQFGAAEEVAPNAYFNANEYYAAKAAQFYGEAFTGSELQIAQVKTLINKEGMTCLSNQRFVLSILTATGVIINGSEVVTLSKNISHKI